MAGNNEWSAEENAYCFIKLLEWKSLKTASQKEQFLRQALTNNIFHTRSADSLKQHLNYLYKLVTGNVKKVPEKDKALVGIYP